MNNQSPIPGTGNGFFLFLGPWDALIKKERVMESSKNKVIVFDTTLRDGEQAPGCHLTASAKVKVAGQLAKMGVDVIEAGFPSSSPADFTAVSRIATSVGRSSKSPEICALSRSIPAEVAQTWDALKFAKKPRIHVFLASSDIHLKHKLKITREEAVRRAVQSVASARAFTPNVQFSAEDASRSDWNFLAAMMEAVISAGASTINIPDTVGYAVPEEFARLVAHVMKRVRNIRKVRVSVHCHDDLGMSVANSLAAITAGARQVECTVNGVGERAGNAALEEIVMAIHARRRYFGVHTGVRTEEIMETSQMVSKKMGMPVQPNKAVVGANAFAHAAGIHQDGILKYRGNYEVIRPETVGVAGPSLVLTARSGRRAVYYHLKEMGFRLTPATAEALFLKFKALADGKKEVTRSELRSLVLGAA